MGGRFTSKEQFRKCYAVTPERYSELEAYLLLPDQTENHQNGKNDKSSNFYNYGNSRFTPEKKELKIPGKFNPDDYSAADFVRLGFSERQAESIIKYRNYLGGSFISKEKFRQCYTLSEENYRKLAPYLLLPESAPQKKTDSPYSSTLKPDRPSTRYKPFDPNLLDEEGWRSLGFSEKQAAVIVKYRERNLKGSFKSLDDIAACFVISSEKMDELKPFIQLNPENFKSLSSGQKNDEPKRMPTDFSKVDLNTITFAQLTEFGFDEKSAAGFLGFRKKLGGFVHPSQITETYGIDKDLAAKLVAVSPLNSTQVAKYSLTDAPEEWLNNHPYFKYHADKIIYYRISNPDEKKILKFLKLKPDAEQRMKLYLR